MRSLAAPVALVAVAAVTPAQLLSSSLKAARAQHSVHYVATATFGSVGVTTVAEAVRLGSTIEELGLMPPLATLGTSTRDGHRVIGIHGRETQGSATGTATLYVEATGSHLPVEETGSEGPIRVSVVFSKWNE